MDKLATLDTFVPETLRDLADPARDLPRLAKSRSAMAAIEAAVVEVPTRHRLLLGDARCASPARRVGPARGHLTAQHAVDHLYRVAVTENKATSTARLDTLAEFCIQELTQRGLLGIEKEASIPGAGPDRHPDRANRSQRPECGQPGVVRRRFGSSNTEITLEGLAETLERC